MNGRKARPRSRGVDGEAIHLAAVRIPLGHFAVAATRRGLCAVVPLGERAGGAAEGAELRDALRRQGRGAFGVVAHGAGDPLPPALRRGVEALAAYGAGSRRNFRGPLDVAGTPFQRAVWRRLLSIRHGATTSYGALARAVGMPKAARAVGAAVGANPISILVPCHRVIGASGSLTGYGGGLPMKRALLAHEGWEGRPGETARRRRRAVRASA